MPTTCGFPNCKFRSRYRGQEDNRHFYRIPKRPHVLRQSWLQAIGRTEETVVSQLRICSAHFMGGEKREGDVPVPDPSIDPQIRIQLPPKESKTAERKKAKSFSDLVSRLTRKNCFFPNLFYFAKLMQSLHQLRTIPKYIKEIERSDSDFYILIFGKRNPYVETYLLDEALKSTKKEWTWQREPHKTYASILFKNERIRVVAKPFARLSTLTLDDYERALMIIVYTNPGGIYFDGKELRKFRHLNHFVQATAYGQSIDRKAATEKGITVSIVDMDFSVEIAELAFMLMTGKGDNNQQEKQEKVKDLSENELPVTAEEWDKDNSQLFANQSSKQCVGILGVTKIGYAIAERAQAAQMTLCTYDPKNRSMRNITSYGELGSFLETADIIFICVDNETFFKKIFKNPILNLAKRQASFINTNIDLLRYVRRNHIEIYNKDQSLILSEKDYYQTDVPVNVDIIYDGSSEGHCFTIISADTWYTRIADFAFRNLAMEEVLRCARGEPLFYCVNQAELSLPPHPFHIAVASQDPTVETRKEECISRVAKLYLHLKEPGQEKDVFLLEEEEQEQDQIMVYLKAHLFPDPFVLPSPPPKKRSACGRKRKIVSTAEEVLHCARPQPLNFSIETLLSDKYPRKHMEEIEVHGIVNIENDCSAISRIPNQHNPPIIRKGKPVSAKAVVRTPTTTHLSIVSQHQNEQSAGPSNLAIDSFQNLSPNNSDNIKNDTATVLVKKAPLHRPIPYHPMRGLMYQQKMSISNDQAIDMINIAVQDLSDSSDDNQPEPGTSGPRNPE